MAVNTGWIVQWFQVECWWNNIWNTLSMSLLAWRLRLLKNIFLLRTCISSTVMRKEATLVPIIALDRDQTTTRQAYGYYLTNYLYLDQSARYTKVRFYSSYDFQLKYKVTVFVIQIPTGSTQIVYQLFHNHSPHTVFHLTCWFFGSWTTNAAVCCCFFIFFLFNRCLCLFHLRWDRTATLLVLTFRLFSLFQTKITSVKCASVQQTKHWPHHKRWFWPRSRETMVCCVCAGEETFCVFPLDFWTNWWKERDEK